GAAIVRCRAALIRCRTARRARVRAAAELTRSGAAVVAARRAAVVAARRAAVALEARAAVVRAGLELRRQRSAGAIVVGVRLGDFELADGHARQPLDVPQVAALFATAQ